MNAVKKLEKWLKEEVEFLLANKDYVGGWVMLDDGPLAVTVNWEPGWGKEQRQDVIQDEDDLDWALCACIKVFNKNDTPDEWKMLTDKETGDIIIESRGILKDEDYKALASQLLNEYEEVKGFDVGEDGVIDWNKGDEGKVDLDDEPKEDEPKEEPPVEEGFLSGKEGEYTHEELAAFEKELFDELAKYGIHPEDGTFMNSDNSLADLKLEMYIDGDWKHDHWATEEIVAKFAREHKWAIARHDSVTVGESESDWYEAQHIWYFVEDSTGDMQSTLDGFHKMFQSDED